MTIVLDAMGSDKYPDPEIQAAVTAAELFGEEIILVGSQALIEPKLKALNVKNLPVVIEDAPDLVEMGEKPVEAARRKPRNSMAVGCGLIKSGRAQAFITAGNTGAAMFNGLRTLGRIPGVARPDCVPYSRSKVVIVRSLTSAPTRIAARNSCCSLP